MTLSLQSTEDRITDHGKSKIMIEIDSIEIQINPYQSITSIAIYN